MTAGGVRVADCAGGALPGGREVFSLLLSALRFFARIPISPSLCLSPEFPAAKFRCKRRCKRLCINRLKNCGKNPRQGAAANTSAKLRGRAALRTPRQSAAANCDFFRGTGKPPQSVCRKRIAMCGLRPALRNYLTGKRAAITSFGDNRVGKQSRDYR